MMGNHRGNQHLPYRNPLHSLSALLLLASSLGRERLSPAIPSINRGRILLTTTHQPLEPDSKGSAGLTAASPMRTNWPPHARVLPTTAVLPSRDWFRMPSSPPSSFSKEVGAP